MKHATKPRSARACEVLALLLLGAAGLAPFAVGKPGKSDIEQLCSVEEFALGGVGFSGQTSAGEVLFQRILARPDNLESFLTVYAKGNNQARMYALLAFHSLDETLYRHIKANYRDRKIEIRHTVGCIKDSASLDAILSDFVEKGFYDRYLPEKYRRKSSSDAKGR
ncbi:MAG: hypothetical protein H7A53_04335 [Akkermansiaceae bacterium]|nr:hypothetical protein [Akkermansiaceae bacterium]